MYWDVPAKEGMFFHEAILLGSGDTERSIEQCASYYNHLITSTVFNISSDLMMLCIPLPLLVRSRLPWKRYVFSPIGWKTRN